MAPRRRRSKHKMDLSVGPYRGKSREEWLIEQEQEDIDLQKMQMTSRAESVTNEEGGGRTSADYLAEMGVVETRLQKAQTDLAALRMALRRSEGEPDAVMLDDMDKLAERHGNLKATYRELRKEEKAAEKATSLSQRLSAEEMRDMNERQSEAMSRPDVSLASSDWEDALGDADKGMKDAWEANASSKVKFEGGEGDMDGDGTPDAFDSTPMGESTSFPTVEDKNDAERRVVEGYWAVTAAKTPAEKKTARTALAKAQKELKTANKEMQFQKMKGMTPDERKEYMATLRREKRENRAFARAGRDMDGDGVPDSLDSSPWGGGDMDAADKERDYQRMKGMTRKALAMRQGDRDGDGVPDAIDPTPDGEVSPDERKKMARLAKLAKKREMARKRAAKSREKSLREIVPAEWSGAAQSDMDGDGVPDAIDPTPTGPSAGLSPEERKVRAKMAKARAKEMMVAAKTREEKKAAKEAMAGIRKMMAEERKMMAMSPSDRDGDGVPDAIDPTPDGQSVVSVRRSGSVRVNDIPMDIMDGPPLGLPDYKGYADSRSPGEMQSPPRSRPKRSRKKGRRPAFLRGDENRTRRR